MLAKANTTARSSCRPAGAHRVDASIEGSDDNDRPWHEAVTGRGQEAWLLLKQLYVERRFGRRNRRYGVRKKVEK